MTDTTQARMTSLTRTPTHLWIVGVVSLLWNLVGVTDYTMTETRNAAYLSAATPAQLAYFDQFPAAMVAFWACGVWGALAGSVLLLMRSRLAVVAFIVSLIGVAGTTLYQYVIVPAPADMSGPGATAMNMVIWAVAIGLLLYARAMRARGVLR